MAFEYAHHRPLTPMTPVHSPHPSGGSSIRMRTPGQLSLHEYRKMQVTPSPPAIPGQKTVKKKRGLSSLSHTESLPARSPTANFFSSFQSLTTPPETPSLEPPLGFTSNVSPVGAQTRSRAADASTYPEFAHLLSLGSELQHSPPYSPSLPSLSSASRPFFQSTSPYQPPTPNYHTELPASKLQPPLKHPLLGSQRSLQRPWSHSGQQDRRYVDLHVEARPRSEGVRRVDSKQVITSDDNHERHTLQRPTRLDDTQDPRIARPPFPGVLAEDQSLDSRRDRTPRISQDSFSQRLTAAAQAVDNTQKHASIRPETSIQLSKAAPSREIHFNPIKRLPRPDSSFKRRPAPLQLTSNSHERLYQSEEPTNSTSTFSLSKYPFPRPPQPFAVATTTPQNTPPANTGDPGYQKLQFLSPKSPSLRFSGVSFEIVNPHSSLDAAEFDAPSDEVENFLNYLDESEESNSDSDMDSDDPNRQPPKGKRFSSFIGAYQTVTSKFGSKRRSRSRPESQEEDVPAQPTTPPRPATASPTTWHQRESPSWRFNELGQRVDAFGNPITSSIEAGPGATQAQLSRASSALSRSTPSVGTALTYQGPGAAVVLPLRTRSGEAQGLLPPLPGASTPPVATHGFAPPSQGGFEAPAAPTSPVATYGFPSPSQGWREPAQHSTEQQFRQRNPPFLAQSGPFLGNPTQGAGVSQARLAPSLSDLATHAGEHAASQPRPLEDVENQDPFAGFSDTAHESAPATRDRYLIPSRPSSPFRLTLYGSEFESESIAEGQENLPAGRATGNTRYSAASSDFHHQHDEDSHRLSEPFPYRQYESRTTPTTPHESTISRFIERYESGRGEPSEFADDDEPSFQSSASHTYAGPSTPRRPRRLRVTNPSDEDSDEFPTTKRRVAANGYSSGSNEDGTPFGRATRGRNNRNIRDVPIIELETREDFDEALHDLQFQPLLRRQSTAFLERCDALFARIEFLFGRQARNDAQNNLWGFQAHSTWPHRIGTPSEPTESSDDTDHLYMRLAQRLVQHPQQQSDLASQSTGWASGGDSEPVAPTPGSALPGTAITTGDDDVEEPPHGLGTLNIGDNERRQEEQQDDDDALTIREPTRYLQRLPSDVQEGEDSSNEFEYLLAPQEPAPASRNFPLQGHGYGHSGPPPTQPAPQYPFDDQMIGLAMVPPLFANRKPFDQSELSSYDNTAGLLGLSPATGTLLPSLMKSPTQESTVKPGAKNHLRLHDSHHTFGCRDPVIPRMWSNHSLPVSVEDADKNSTNHSNGPSEPSQTDEDVAAAMDDTDEWETEPSRTQHSSRVPEGFNYDELMKHPLPMESAHIPGVHGSNLVGFYPAEQLSPEPHDDYETSFGSPLNGTRHGHSRDDLELGPITPVPERAYKSRHVRSSVRNQNGLHDLLLPQAHAHRWSNPPVMYGRPQKMSKNGKLWRDGIIVLCCTVFAVIGVGPIFLLIGCLSDGILRSRRTTLVKRIAMVELTIFVIALGISLGIGIYALKTN